MGILDYPGRVDQPWIASPVDQGIGYGLPGGQPRPPQQGGGLLDFGQNQGRQPLSDEQKRSILFSAIADSFDSVRGINSDTTGKLSKQFHEDNTKQQDAKRRAAVNQAISTAYDQAQKTGDMTPVRHALMAADAAGEDVSHITQHLQFGAPKDVAYSPGQTVFSQDPFSGNLTQKLSIPQKANPNEPFNVDGSANKPYQDYQVALARARAQAQADFRAPKSANPNAPVILGPHPSAGY